MAMGAMGPADAIGGIGDIMGLIGGLKQQGQTNQAISGIGSNLSNILGLEGTDAGKMLSSYLGTTLPQLQQMVSTLTPEQQQAFGGAMGAFGNVGNVAGQFLQPGSTPSMGQMGHVAQQLDNWHGLKPQELNALTMQAGNAANSAAQTMKQQMGGVANPGMLMQQLTNQAGQTGAQAAVGIGAQAAGQELQAREGAGQLYGQMTGDQIQKMQDAMSGYEAQGQGLSGLSSQALQGIMSSLGMQTQGMETGAGMLGQTGNTLNSLLQNYMYSPQAQQNPWGSFFQNIAGMVPTTWGGGGNSSSGTGGTGGWYPGLGM